VRDIVAAMAASIDNINIGQKKAIKACGGEK